MSLGAQKLPRPRPGQDWDAKKDILQRLYLKENKPLRKIVGIMHHQYLFLATYVCSKLWIYPELAYVQAAVHEVEVAEVQL